MEIKMGSFFFVAAILFLFTLLSIKEVKLFKSAYFINVKFDFVEGLRPSSPVRFCGVDVGEVKDVVIREEGGRPKVIAVLKIQRKTRIPNNAYFFINGLSLLGEKYLEITPSGDSTGYLDEGDTVVGLSPMPMFNVLKTFDDTMKELSAFVNEGKMKATVENTLANLEKASDDIKVVTGQIRNKEGTIGRLLYDDSLYKYLEEFVADLQAHPWKLLYKPDEPKKKK
jgi:phospholipid/cholesterol/gamma-HCH transport system substrate-binding protein